MDRLWHPCERQRNHLVHVVDEMDAHLFPDLGGKLLQVAGILGRDEHGLAAEPMGGEELLLETADGQHPAPRARGHGDPASP